jgi:SpoVK/Ycf46/Vps4 family AAA+-type ATPase
VPAKESLDKLKSRLRSGYKLIHFSTVEEARAEDQLLGIAQTGDAGKRWRDYYLWTATGGFRGLDGKEANGAKDTDKPDKAFQWVVDRERKKCTPTMYVMKDLHPFIGGRSANALVVRKLKDTIRELEPTMSAIILLSGPQLEIPPELEKDIVIVDFELPDLAELRGKYTELVAENKGRPKVTIDLTDRDIESLAKAAQGLTLAEAELAFGKALSDDVVAGREARLDASKVAVIQEEKKQIVRKTGILTVEEAGDMGEVGGLEVLKKWLDKRKNIFSEDARKYGILSPKGVLLTGVPGCGKSLCAKAMASFWGIPILRLDMGAIFGGLVGASEANMRRAISCAKAMAPCVLMIDEIEKGLAGMGGGDGGTSPRVFGTLLTWMSDKTEPVFIVATANEFERLPPEMLRKGRFDELFFVDFPHAGERTSIFKIHVQKALKRRQPRPSSADIKAFLGKFEFDAEHTIGRTDKDGHTETVKGTVVQLSNNFTGSEIEEAVKTAMINAFSDNEREFTANDIALAIGQTVPLIDTMADKIESLRARARECTISASQSPDGEQPAQVVEPPESKETPSEPPRPLRGGRAMDI